MIISAPAAVQFLVPISFVESSSGCRHVAIVTHRRKLTVVILVVIVIVVAVAVFLLLLLLLLLSLLHYCLVV